MEALYEAIYHTVEKYHILVTQKANAKALFDKLGVVLVHC